jgi:L-aspartate oxidase
VLPTPSEPSSRAPDGTPIHEADVAIVGAGIAGLFAATRLVEAAPDARVVVLDKSRGAGAGSSPWAQGGMAVAVGADDSTALHAADTLIAGEMHGSSDAAAVLAGEGVTRLEQLLALGAEFDRTDDGSLHLAREGGQRVARSVHRADATGAEMVRVLRRAAAPSVRRLRGTGLALHADPGVVAGIWALGPEGLVLLRAPHVLLATGGCGGIFRRTTNPVSATGDGLALAWQVGAALRDLEFVQFHPTGLVGPRVGGSALLITEALRGAGATLHDEEGYRFMPEVHPDAELAPRHVVTRAIVARERVWLDATALGEERLLDEFPTVHAALQERGLDPAAERIEVGPVAHYQVGGIRTDLDGRTSITGLWAAGEVAATGVHGANRMAGNSLLEALVFGGRAAEAIATAPPRSSAVDGPEPPALAPVPNVDLERVRVSIRRAMWEGCGPVRDAAGLAQAARSIAGSARSLGPPAADAGHVELVHALTVAGLLLRAATLRQESRGCHIRDDHPAPDPAWEGAHLDLVRPGSPPSPST